MSKFLICLLLCAALIGCGKRAAMVSAPDDVTDDKYPHTYPKPSTDPTPSN